MPDELPRPHTASPHDGRFAPSPTGELHLGNLRTALVAWLFARSAGARFGVRIEDLDQGRVRERFVDSQLADLRALGLDWDGEPVRQSARTALYGTAIERLRARGRVFRCFCSRREVHEAASAQHGKLPEGFYPGTCARLSEPEAARRSAAGEPFALRLRAGRERVTFADRLRGEQAAIVDDLVLRRRDGAFAYNLAVVVDDHDQEVGEVVRGDDLLPSTAGQALLCDLLGLGRPSWAHVPLVLAPDGSRLAKRHGAVSLGELGEAGWEPARVRALLGSSLGLAKSEEAVGPEQLVDRFDPARLPRSPSTYDAGTARLYTPRSGPT